MARVVGKNVLESITTGMYSDNRVIYREYIQNSTDAIDNAVKEYILEREENRIDITVNLNRRQIRIRDNGTGIPAKNVYNILGDIGKSEKDYKEQRGFRGIGRLGGLGYCEELRFVTSYNGESTKTVTIWDCVKLKRLLQPNVAREMDVIDVVNEVTTDKVELENKEAHYFEVILIGIDQENSNLLYMENIENYISQVAPVPFNYQKFTELKRINKKIIEHGKEPEEYNVYLNNEQIYKPYKRRVVAGNKEKDFIKSIEFFEGYKQDGQLFFIGWYGVTDLSGLIKENDLNGIRVRKNNILIGDNHSLDNFFGNNPSYRRFNRWFVGEIYVYDDQLIPNARRDDFEKNPTYLDFKKEVEKTTKNKLCKRPYAFSKERTERKVIKSSSIELQNIKKEMSRGITTTSKERILDNIEKIENKVTKITGKIVAKDDEKSIDQSSKRIDVLKNKVKMLNEIRSLRKKVTTSRNYKTNKIPSSYSKSVRRVIRVIFEVIDRSLPEGQAQELQDRIIEKLSEKKKQ